MRKTPRPAVAPEKLLTSGVEEQDAAVEVYTAYLEKLAAARQRQPPGTPPKKPTVTFRMYKDASVKEILRALFDGKCAYCESFYSSTQPMDVEHYRPKGAVDGEDDHLGYYWLAATWENLLPSCIDCNRRRGQFDVLEGKNRTLGKKDRFPVAGTRATSRDDDLAQEAPLLVDPTVDDPSVFFRFDPELGVVMPRDADGPLHDRAVESIETFGLNRSGLVADRRHIIRQFDHHLRVIELLAAVRDGLADAEDGPLHTILVEVIELELDALFSLADHDRPYSAMAEQFLDDLDAHLDPPP